MNHVKLLASVAAASFLLTAGVVGSANAHPGGVPGVNVKVKDIRKHQAALQKIADENNGTRASGTPGYEASLAYVKKQLMKAGISVTEQPFLFPFYQEFSPSEMSRLSAPARTYVNGTDFATMDYSGSGMVTADVQAVIDIQIPPGPTPSSSNAGCEAADFAGFVPGRIALIQRGTCAFGEKAQNAKAAGAVGVVIFNEGQPGRTEVLSGTTLGGPIDIPVLGTSFDVGAELYDLLDDGPAVTLSMKTDTTSVNAVTKNLIAELPGGRSDNVVVVGAHLDSVLEGPGINDNGSGSAMTLEIALRMKKHHLRPKNKVRFIWFGAEEAGLLGSEHYVANLTDAERDNIKLNLNFDMVASPNFVRFVYDGDGSDTPDAGPPGSDEIERVFNRFFEWRHLPVEPTAFDGRSDYGPFIDAGIPAGGLFTGAEALKTPEQQAVFGGTAGEQLDPCYHEACDTYDNNSNQVLGQMSRAAAFTTMWFAYKRLDAQPARAKTARKASDTWLYKGGHLQR